MPGGANDDAYRGDARRLWRKLGPQPWAVYREKGRQRRQKPENKEKIAARNRAYLAQHPDQKRAHDAVGKAIQSGRLIRPSVCTHCLRERGLTQTKIEGHHHHGYDRAHWLDVQWVCKVCHLVVEQA